MLSLSAVLKIKEASDVQGLEGAENMDGDQDDDESGKEKAEDFLDAFLDSEQADGLDDHPDIELSPVFMYNIKKAKEAQRAEAQRQSLLAEGMTADEVDERMSQMGASGGAPAVASPLAILIAVGARTEATKGKTSEEMLKKQDIRRKQRNIEVYLNNPSWSNNKSI